MTNQTNTLHFLITATFAFVASVGELRAVELSSLPGVTLAKVELGMNESDFIELYPSARKAGGSPSVQQYWMMQEVLHMLDFRQGKLALIMVSLGGANGDDQRQQTTELVQQYVKRFGSPKVAKTAKLLRKGVAEMRALIYDLKEYRASTKAIMESSELELAITIYDENLRGTERLFFPASQLLDELNKNATQPKVMLKSGTYVDYVEEYVVQHANSTSPMNSINDSPRNNVRHANSGTNVQTTVPKADKSIAEQPDDQPTSSTPWSVVGVLIVAAIGLLWLLLKRRAK